MAEDVSRKGRDEIGEDETFERRWQAVQRLSWGALAAFVLAGLAGVFGRGPVSGTRVVTDTGLAAVRYQRFARCEAPAMLEIGIDPRIALHGEVEVLVGGMLIKALRIGRTSPRPLRVESLPDGELFAFASSPDSWTSVRFSEEPQHAGRLTGRLRIANGGGRVAVSQLIYP